ATRQARAAHRATATWARHNAADLRRLAGQITALDHLAPQAHSAQAALDAALGATDAAELITPLNDMRPYLDTRHTHLIEHLDALNHRRTATTTNDD
ncbi:type III effector protein, partial [Streptomyces sp. NPDC053474]